MPKKKIARSHEDGLMQGVEVKQKTGDAYAFYLACFILIGTLGQQGFFISLALFGLGVVLNLRDERLERKAQLKKWLT